MVNDVCNNIQQEELLVIHGKEFSVPVNILKKRKYVLHKHDTKADPEKAAVLKVWGEVGGEIVGERGW